MNKRMVLGAMAAVVALGLSVAAWAQAKQDFVLVNKTGYVLSEVYVGPSASEDWGNDVLGQDVLAKGAKANIHFNPKAQTCKWDLRVVYEEDDSDAVWSGIDLCAVSTITIKYNKNTDTTSATFD